MIEKTVGYTENNRYTSLDDLRQLNAYDATSAISLDYCGMENCISGFQFGPYVRTDYVIHMVVSGRGTYRWKDRIYPVEANQAFLIFPQEKTVYKADEREPWSYMWIGFHGLLAEEFVEEMGFSRENPVIPVRQMEALTECIKRMLKASQLTHVNELRRTSELLQMVAIFMEDNEQMLSGKKQDYPSTVYVHSAMDYMRYHMQEKIRMEDLADYIGISRSHLTGSFKKELGMSPLEYLINLRMEYAASLLRNTAKPVNLVSAYCGYEDSLSFSKAFKLKYGMSPTAYRNQKVELVINREKGDYTSGLPL